MKYYPRMLYDGPGGDAPTLLVWNAEEERQARQAGWHEYTKEAQEAFHAPVPQPTPIRKAGWPKGRPRK